MGTGTLHTTTLVFKLLILDVQEGYLAKHAVSEEDKLATEQAEESNERPQDPMQGLEQLDVAGPKPE